MRWKRLWHVLHLVLCCSCACLVGGEQRLEFVAASLGRPALLHCELEFPGGLVQPYTVHWLKQGQTAPIYLWQEGKPPVVGPAFEGRALLAGPASLNISRVVESDLGWYECRIFVQSSRTDDAVEQNSTLVHLEIEDPDLHFVEEPHSVTLLPGSSKELRCSTLPRTALGWLRDGRPLSSLDRDIEMEPGRLVLRMRPDRPSHLPSLDGLYQCTASFGDLAFSSRPARVTVTALRPFQDQNDVTLEVPEGSVAVITCQVPLSHPAGVLRLERSGGGVVPISGRVQPLQNDGFKFSAVTKADEGAYRCSVENEVLNRKETSRHTVNLVVTGRAGNRMPELLAKPRHSSYAVPLSGNLTLECVASGIPQPTVTWIRYGGELPRGRNVQRDGKLFLINLQKADEGTYVCQAENGVGHAAVAHTIVEIQEKPSIVHSLANQNQTVKEGGEVMLDCSGGGVPKPALTWVHNSVPLETNNDQVVFRDSGLVLRRVSLEMSGLYQCFAANDLGTVYSTARIRVIPRRVGAEAGGADAGSGDKSSASNKTTSSFPFPHHVGHRPGGGGHRDPNMQPPLNEHHPNKKWKQRHRNKQHRQRNNHSQTTANGKANLVPPTLPLVTKLSDESVMVRWDVPENDGLPITFFKVQYKDVSKSNARWRTIDDEIAPHIHSFEVPNLKTGHTYRFRIAAVYSNSDNKQGPNSAKFVLQKDPPMKKPTVGPVIVHSEAVSPSAIKISWQLQHLDLDMVPVEGFFVYYRSTTSAGDYSKVTVIGANTRTHIITHLLPDVAYDIKMQCFNIAGASEFSNILKQKTFSSENFVPLDQETKLQAISPVTTTQGGNDMVSTILGVVLGCMVAILLVVMIFCGWKQRQQRQQFLAALDRTNKNVNPAAPANRNLPANGHLKHGNGHIPMQPIGITVNPLGNADESLGNDVAETSLCQDPADGKRNCKNRYAPSSEPSKKDEGTSLLRSGRPVGESSGEAASKACPLEETKGSADDTEDDT